MRRKKKDDRYLLSRLKQYGAEVTYLPGASPEPSRNSAAFLDHLDQWAETLALKIEGAAAIRRRGQKFILDRPERKRTYYTSMRTALRKLVFEVVAKAAARSG